MDRDYLKPIPAMSKFLSVFLVFFIPFEASCQYTEPWSDPVMLTDAESYNSNPEVVVVGNQAFMFYEKRLTPGGPSRIYYREIKTMGEETELLGDPVFSFRNPTVVKFEYPDDGYCLYYESDIAGNFDLYGLRFDGGPVFGEPVQLTFTPDDENSAAFDYNYDHASWINNGNLLAAKVIHDPDTIYLANTQTIDYTGCGEPRCCAFRIVYLKSQGDSAAVWYADWQWDQLQWGDPVVLDSIGNNGYCSCDRTNWFISSEDCIVYEKEGSIINWYYDEFYPIEPTGFGEDMHQPNSALYDIPVEYSPAPLFITFASEAEGYSDIYAFWMMGEPVENISQDTLPNANPLFFWGWFGSNPCSQYFLDIWETEEGGYRPLYMSKCALYVCGGTDEAGSGGDRLVLSPNPFGDVLAIRYFPVERGEYTVSIRSSEGKLLRQFTQMALPGEWNETTFRPDAGTAPGMLVITVGQKGRELFRKVIYK